MLALMILAAAAGPADDRATVSALDVTYQAAVKRNDADAMARILDKDFVLILGDGRVISRNDLLDFAAKKKFVYERQDEKAGSQMVHLYGDTAVVTAKLWLKGKSDGKPFDRLLWFSDTYVRGADGWHYVLGQASLPLPPEAATR